MRMTQKLLYRVDPQQKPLLLATDLCIQAAGISSSVIAHCVYYVFFKQIYIYVEYFMIYRICKIQSFK